MARNKAVAYFRTSSASGVGDEKDTLPRQQEAVRRYANLENIEIVAEFYDGNVSGVIPVMERPEFTKMFEFCVKKKIDIVLVETANRFSRDVITQLNGHDFLKKNGITLIPADAPKHFLDDTPTAKMIRVIIGAVSMYEKESLVKKMGDARKRKKEKGERSEGRIPPLPEAVAMAKELRSQGVPFGRIGIILSENGFRVREKNKKTGVVELTDRIFQAQSVKNMIESL